MCEIELRRLEIEAQKDEKCETRNTQANRDIAIRIEANVEETRQVRARALIVC